jgi:hypothetical protein
VARRLAYPTDHLLAVVDDPAAASAAVERLLASGFAADDVILLHGPDAAARIDGLGASGGPLRRLVRLVQFTTMDQMPDFRLYEAAIGTGRAVVAVHVRDRAAVVRARDILAAAGGHFMNRYGRLSTEELAPWQGPELDLPSYLRR